jgi:hypothetical protein
MTVQFEFAKTSSGKIVHVTKAEKGEKFTCANPNCNGEMILKKGEIRRPHFAHKHVEYDHGGETPLHYNTKILLFDFLQNSAINETPTFVQFKCSCSETHSINLLEHITDVYVEKQVTKIYRPDISLYSENKFKMALEIIVTHDLESEASSYLKKHEIPYLTIKATSHLYSALLQRYITNTLELLELSEDVEIEGIDTLDYCKNNVPVTYYPDLKNIFPCFGYENNDESSESSGWTGVDDFTFNHDFRGKIDDGILPCNTCKYFHTKVNPTLILCKNPLAKKNVFCEWDKHLTPTIFKFDKYYKSGKRHRENVNCIEFKEKIDKYRPALDFFEYERFAYCFSDSGGKYMKTFKNGKWVELNDSEILMKEVMFWHGKHEGKSLEYVYKNDLDYLLWILFKRPDGIYFKEVLEAVIQMRKDGLL